MENPAKAIEVSIAANAAKEFAQEPVGSRAMHFSMEPLQFAVHSDWTVASFCTEARIQFYEHLNRATPLSETQLNLRELLKHVEPTWLEELPESVASILFEKRIFLPWDAARKAHGMGWSVYALQCGQNLFCITLTPTMCPSGEAKLAENSLSFDGAGIKEVLRELFLRTQQQEARFQFFVRHLPGAHFKQDNGYFFTTINPALEELVGVESLHELSQGVHWLDWVHPNDRKELLRTLKRCKTANLPSSCRFRLLLPDCDRVLHLMELRIPVRGIDGNLNGYEGLWLDLSREELAQQHLQHSAWKDCLAQISGSLSHDFNNMLMGLVSLSELLIMGLEETDEHFETASLIKSTTLQAKELSGRIISLNREERGQPQLCNLTDLVTAQSDLIRILLPKDTTIKWMIPKDEFPVRVDMVSLRRILVNFATNARDVLEYKGNVEVRLHKIDFSTYDCSCLVSNHCQRKGEAVELVFADNGPGIPPEIISRIFGAYFSTKDCTTSFGSGLGLYCLTQFARDNHFDYGVRTKLGEGTEMILVFPLIGEDDLAIETEHESRLLASFDEAPIAFFGISNSATNAILAGLKRQGIEICELSDETDLKNWLKKRNQPARSLLMAFAYNDHKKVRRICESVNLEAPGLQTILSLQGLNPEHFSDLIGKKFDSLIMPNAKTSATLKNILTHLSSHAKPKGASMQDNE